MTPKPEARRAIIYARVSSANGSTIEQQLDALAPALPSARLGPLRRRYTDHGVSGAKEKRPGLDRLMADARAKRCDVVCIWKFDRFARSTDRTCSTALKEFDDLRIAFVSLTENVDTTTAYGRAVFRHFGRRCGARTRIDERAAAREVGLQAREGGKGSRFPVRG